MQKTKKRHVTSSQVSLVMSEDVCEDGTEPFYLSLVHTVKLLVYYMIPR